MNNSNSIRINENESKKNKKGVQIKINSLDLKEEEVRKKKAKAFISNSFNIENKKYSFGAIIYYKNIKKNFSGIVDEAIYESMGTPGAQMYGCIKTIEEASKSIDYISSVKIIEQRAKIDGNKISEYFVDLDLGFTLDLKR